jgi:hypothetical protein
LKIMAMLKVKVDLLNRQYKISKSDMVEYIQIKGILAFLFETY